MTSQPPWSIPHRRRLGDLIEILKCHMGKTSIVVTHDTRFAERLADLVLFLHQAGRCISALSMASWPLLIRI